MTWAKFDATTTVKKAIIKVIASKFQKTSFGLGNLRIGN